MALVFGGPWDLVRFITRIIIGTLTLVRFQAPFKGSVRELFGLSVWGCKPPFKGSIGVLSGLGA